MWTNYCEFYEMTSNIYYVLFVMLFDKCDPKIVIMFERLYKILRYRCQLKFAFC